MSKKILEKKFGNSTKEIMEEGPKAIAKEVVDILSQLLG
jgi:hypothetical protein